MVSICIFKYSFSTFLLSHIFTYESSETEIKCVYFPLLGALLSGSIPDGIKAISPTKFLWEYTILDYDKCFILIIVCDLSFSSSATGLISSSSPASCLFLDP